jgi:hypothetical protein
MRNIPASALSRLVAGFATFSALASAATAATIYSNAAIPGDSFTNTGATNTGQAVMGGWHYNNVRNSGVVGINTNIPRSGNGSVYLEGRFGPAGASSKADIERLGNAVANPAGNFAATAALGLLGQLTSLRYDWYRRGIASPNEAAAHLHPALRLLIVSPDASQWGYIVFEREVSRDDFGHPAPIVAPEDQWVTDDLFAGNFRMWSTGSTLPYNLNGTNGPARYYDALRLSEWRHWYGSYLVLGVSAGVGSGWGEFQGAVDNIRFGFNHADTTHNFEAVPEPATLTALALGALALIRRRRQA